MDARFQRLITAATAGLLLSSLFLQPSLGQATTSTNDDLVIILDASGSMWGQIEGENKIVIARRVLADLAESLPDETNVGLVAYGHRREGDCDDIQTVIPLGPLDRAGFTATVDALNPKGKTLITKSINETVSLLESHDGPVTVVLVSDGLETCSGDPCAVVREARASGIELLMHVVGFDMGDADVSDLQCAAEASGGRYFDARSADELSAALNAVVEAPLDSTNAVISIGAMANGELLDAGVWITDTETGADVAFQRTYAGETTNPRHIGVNAGLYNVEVGAISLSGDVRVTFDSVRVAPGDTVFKHVDFSPGILSVGVTRNGALSDATVNIFKAGTKERVAGGRTYNGEKSNPMSKSITPGLYDVHIGSVEIKGPPRQTFENIQVLPDSATELQHEFPSAIVEVGAVRGSELIDATVNITDTGTGAAVAGGRTYVSETSNPKAFILSPGSYVIRVKALKLEGATMNEFEVTVAARDSVRQIIEF